MDQTTPTQSLKYTVLITEDETPLRETLARALTDAGFAVLQAENGTKGLDFALHHKPDLILLDIRMPEMSGFQMLSRLRDSGSWGLHVPALFLTNIALSDEQEKSDIANLEPKSYIVKSDTSMSDIVARVKQVLGA